MKNFTKFLALAAILLASVPTWGRVSPGEVTTDRASFTTGTRFFVQGRWGTDKAELEGNRWFSTYFPSLEADSVVASDAESVSTEAAWELEEAGTTYTIKYADGTTEALKGFYVKSVRGGNYLNRSAESGASYNCDLYLQETKSTIWYFCKSVSMATTEESPEEKVNVAPETAMDMFTISSDSAYLLRLNNNYTVSGKYTFKLGYFNNSTTWHEFYEAVEDNGLTGVLADLDELYTLSSTLYGTLKTGTDPGCCTQEAYEALDVAMSNSQDDSQIATLELAQACYDALLKAYLTAEEAKVPMHNGYYWIKNSNLTTQALTIKNVNEVWWAPVDTTKAEYIWKVTDLGDGLYELYNYGTKQVVDNGDDVGVWSVEGSSETNVKLTYAGSPATFNIYVMNSASQWVPTYDYHNIHPLSWDSSQSTGHIASLWAAGHGNRSGWTFTEVPDDIVKALTPQDEQIAKEKEFKALSDSLKTLNDSVSTIIAGAMDVDSTSAVSVRPTAEAAAENNYADFFSNAAMSAEHGYSFGSDGGGYAALIDGDKSTFFHTNWTGTATQWSDYTDDGTGYGYETTKHNLGVKMTQAVDNVSFRFLQRSNYADAPRQFDLEVSNDGVNWTTIFYGYNFYTVINTAGTQAFAGPIEFGDKYQYVRFSTTGCLRGTYFSLAEWEVLTDVKYTAGCALNGVTAETRVALFNAISNANHTIDVATVDSIDMVKAAIAELTEAYNKFNSSFVDPAELKTALSAAQTFLNQYVQSEDVVATYSMESDTTALSTLVEEANDLLTNGGYTAETITAKAAALNEAVKAQEAYIILPDPNKWYQFQFCSEEEWTDYGFTSDSKDLIDRVACVTSSTDSLPVMTQSAGEIVYGSAWVRSMAAGDVWDCPDLSYFRFIALGDSGYAIQNKATGLYIPNLTTSGKVNLSQTPGVFNVEKLGYGFATLESQNLITGENTHRTLHFGNPSSEFYIVGWVTGMSTKSAFHIVTVEDVDEIGSVKMEGAKAITFPENVTVNEGAMAYLPIGKVTKEDGTTYIAWENVDEIPAGTPGLIIPDDADAAYSVSLGSEIVNTAKTTTGVRGGFTSVEIPDGSGAIRHNTADDTYIWQIASASGLSSTAFSIYLDMTQIGAVPEVSEDDAQLLTLIKGYNAVTGIDKVTTDGAAKHAIYTIDGVKVNAQPSDLAKGIYIIDGKKVIVL